MLRCGADNAREKATSYTYLSFFTNGAPLKKINIVKIGNFEIILLFKLFLFFFYIRENEG